LSDLPGRWSQFWEKIDRWEFSVAV